MVVLGCGVDRLTLLDISTGSDHLTVRSFNAIAYKAERDVSNISI